LFSIMSHVATLISAPTAPALTPALIEAARAALATAAPARILAEGIAVDLDVTVTAGEERAVADDLRTRLAAPVDVVIQPTEGRRKRLFLADMDSTMIGQECIDELAAELGLKAHIAAITERAMRGEIEFEPAVRERVGLLAGLPIAVVGKVIDERIRLTPGGIELVRTMRAAGAWTTLVSGGFTVFTGPISARIGFHEHRSNTLLVEDGRLTGGVADPIVGKNAKLATLHELCETKRIPIGLSMAVGDGANDLPMILAAGLGVAFRAKPKVAAAAPARIDHGDLSALLYLQGYRRDEFVGA
jgi:phosphoserine phosphatase